MHSYGTTEQLRLGYNASNYTSFTADSSGNLTIAPTGNKIILPQGTSLNFSGSANYWDAIKGTYSGPLNILPYWGLLITGLTGSGSSSFPILDVYNSHSASLTASLLRVRDVTATRLLVNSSGNVGIGTTNPTSQLQVNIGTAATVGSIIEGAASQSADLQEWQNSSASVLASISSAGLATAANIIDNGVTASTYAYYNGSKQLVSATIGTGLANSSGTLSSKAVYQIGFQPGLLTSVTNTIGVFGKVSNASTVDNIEGSAILLHVFQIQQSLFMNAGHLRLALLPLQLEA